ncbi:MAG: glycosyltransferase family 4 protein [Bacteroidales bacterium]|nr:glycosyltransferase family 4 protein [Bacteroidales bacterium]
MDGTSRKSVVVSAVNIRKGGTLTVLRDCLACLSRRDDLKVTAIVHNADLCRVEGVRYIEIPWSVKSWAHRLWCEYVTLRGISRKMGVPDLWLSMHDTTPRVHAARQAVYCHTAFPFMKIKAQDFRFDAKIPLFALFTKYAYRAFVRRNSFLIVQQEWFRKGLSSLTGFPEDKIIVAPPAVISSAPFVISSGGVAGVEKSKRISFLYPSTPDCHKNFETLCEASALLEKKLGPGAFRTVLTISGEENRYSRWLKSRWGGIESISFKGFLPKEELLRLYGEASALVFPSRSETWGLPISEFLPSGKPLILADLPYAHETASGAPAAAFFNPDNAQELAGLMEKVVAGTAAFSPVAEVEHSEPFARDWDSLLNILLG